MTLTAISPLSLPDLDLLARVLSGHQLSESESDRAVSVIDTHAREIFTYPLDSGNAHTLKADSCERDMKLSNATVAPVPATYQPPRR